MTQVERTVHFVVSHGFKRVALQLPDDLLCYAPSLASSICKRLGPTYTVAVLADTAFNAEAVDEVAARHMNADCVIHYGRASLAAVSQLPVCYVFPRVALNTAQAAKDIAASLSSIPLPSQPSLEEAGLHARAVLLLDQGYLHALQPLMHELHQLVPKGWQLIPAQAATTAAPQQQQQQQQQHLQSQQQGCCAAASEPQASANGSSCCNGDAACITAAAQRGTSAGQHTDQNEPCCTHERTQQQQQQQGEQQHHQAPRPHPSSHQSCPPSSSPMNPAENSRSSDSGNGSSSRERDKSSSSRGSHSEPVTVAGYSWQLPVASDSSSSGVGAAGGADAASPSANQQQQLEQRQGSSDGAANDSAHSTSCHNTACTPPPPLPTWHVWVGPQEAPSLQALQLALCTQQWLRYTPPPAPATPESVDAHAGVDGNAGVDTYAGEGNGAAAAGAAAAEGGCASGGATEFGLSPSTQALLKRRYFLVEKAKDASIVGILVGTLAVAGLKEAMSNLRRLIAAADKHSYTMLVGKPNPTKLANFPEVDVWVMLADPLGYVLDSKPYLAPILTPYEAVLALTGRSLPLDQPYHLDLQCLIDADASEVAGGLAAAADEAPGALVALGRGQVARVHGAGQQVTAHNAAEYLQMVRSFKGLEAPVAGAAPKAPSAAVEGQRGRAASYANEGS